MKNKHIIITIIVLIALSTYFLLNNKGVATQNKSSKDLGNPSTIGTNIGDFAPQFSYTTIDDKKVDSSSFDSKVVVITSAAAWCPTCALEAEQFSPIYEKYNNNKQVVFITVDIDPMDTKEAISKFKKDMKTPWDYTNLNGGKEIIEKYHLNRFEITYIIDKQGKISFKDFLITNSEKLNQEISKLL